MRYIKKLVNNKCPFLAQTNMRDIVPNRAFLMKYWMLCPALVKKEFKKVFFPNKQSKNISSVQTEQKTRQGIQNQQELVIIKTTEQKKKCPFSQKQEEFLDDYSKSFSQCIKNLKDEGRYRVFINVLRKCGSFPEASHVDPTIQDQQGQPITIWCSNDYMGMGQNEKVKESLISALQETGCGAGGTRNIGGNSLYHVQLEEKLAELHHKEAGLVCGSGFTANMAALTGIQKAIPDIVFISDEKNHSSIIEGMRSTKADKLIFKHNDLEDLEQKLIMTAHKSKLIVFESVYSMNGSIAPIKGIIDLAKKYNAMTLIDEVHAVALYGDKGGGIAQQLHLEHSLDFITGTLGKGFGLYGGYIVGNKNSIDCIRSFSSFFIFTTAFPPFLAKAAIESIDQVMQSQKQREKLQLVAQTIKKKLKENNIPVIPNPSHIVPVFIGNARISNQLPHSFERKRNIKNFTFAISFK